MKSLFNFNFLASLICLLILGSCSEDDSELPITDAELIGSGDPWKLSTITANGISVVSFIDACSQDNLVTFTYDTPISIGIVDEGATKCDDSDPQTVDFTWDYNESTKVLSVNTDIIEVPGAEGGLVVESVTSTELVLSQNVTLLGSTQKAILILVH